MADTTSKMYLFKGDKYIQIDVPTGTIDSTAPASIGDDWDGMTDIGFDSGVDAAAYCQSRIFFFKDDQYAIFDTMAKSVTLYGPMTDYFKSLPGETAGSVADFTKGIDAAMDYNNSTLYLFKGNYSTTGYTNTDPMSVTLSAATTEDWGWPVPYSYGITAAMNLNGTQAFVRGDSVHFYSGGVTFTLECLWPGVRDLGFGDNIDAALLLDFEINPPEEEPQDD